MTRRQPPPARNYPPLPPDQVEANWNRLRTVAHPEDCEMVPDEEGAPAATEAPIERW